MDTKIVSIVIPIYNGEKYLDKCLNSIKRQTFRDFEIVFVDDASPDNSFSIVHKFMSENEDIDSNYIKLEQNKGIANAKRIGLENAKGIYILFHDQDDWMDECCLEVLVNAALSSESDRVTASYREVGIDGENLRVVTYGKNFSKWFATALHATLYKKEVFIDNNILIPNDTQMEDGYINSNFAYYTDKCLYLDDVVYNYLIREDSTSGAKNNSEKWNAETLFRSALECYLKLYHMVKTDIDKASIEYMVIKQYYYYLLHNNRYSKYKDAVGQYKRMNAEIVKHFSDYKNNKLIFLSGDNGDRKTGQRLIFLLSRIEKYGLMKIFIRTYIFMSKFKYFN